TGGLNQDNLSQRRQGAKGGAIPSPNQTGCCWVPHAFPLRPGALARGLISLTHFVQESLMSDQATAAAAERFQAREELDPYIEQQTAAAVETAVGSGEVRVERRVPWATSGPVGQDSAGYSVLKAAAYALGFIGPEQAKEEIHVHQQLRDLYRTYG